MAPEVDTFETVLGGKSEFALVLSADRPFNAIFPPLPRLAATARRRSPNHMPAPRDDRSPDDAPSRAEEHVRLARRHLRAGRIREAIRALELALECGPDRGEWHFELSRLLESDGRVADALVAAQAALRRLPRRLDVRSAVARLLARLGEFEASLAAARAILAEPAARRTCDEAWATAITCYARLERLEEAETTYYLALEDLPRRPLVLVAMGEVQRGVGRHRRAAWCFAEALRESPRQPGLRLVLARTLVTCGASGEALAMYEDAVRDDAPGVALAALLECGDLLASLHRPAEAIRAFRRAAEAAPGAAAPRVRLARALNARGRCDEARRELELAYAVEPDADGVRLRLAEAEAAAGARERAGKLVAEEVGRGLDWSRDDLAAEAIEAAGGLLAADAAETTIPLLEALVSARPLDLAALRRLMVASFAAGRSRRGRGLARRLRRLDPSSRAAVEHNLTLDAIRMGRLDLASRRLRAALRGQPSDPSLRRLRIRWLVATLRSWFSSASGGAIRTESA